jgi:ABC-type transporter Mla subunit MlaD
MSKTKRVSPRERRLNGAQAQATVALNVFRQAAADLEAAAETAEAVEAEIAEEVRALGDLAAKARLTSKNNRAGAEKIRELLGNG